MRACRGPNDELLCSILRRAASGHLHTSRARRIGHGMNERADRLAAQGAQGMHSRGGRIYVPTDGDGRGHGPRERRLRSAWRAGRPPGGFGAGLRAGGGRGQGGEGRFAVGKLE